MMMRANSSLILLFLSFLAFPSCNPCADTLKSKVASPDHQLVAASYERNCGATTDFSSIVNVQSTASKFDGDDGVLFVAKGRYDISVEWVGPRALTIHCTGCSRKNIFREVTALGDIDVRYEFAENPERK